LDWFVLEIDENVFEFRSTNGRLLAVANAGCCTVTNGKSTPSSQFLFQQTAETQVSKANLHCGPKDLRIIKSRSGLYLGIDPIHLCFICSEQPSYWQTGECEGSIVCVQDSPARRQHYLHLSTIQTREYILRKRERYFRFDIGQLTLKEALDLAGAIQADEFGEERCDRSLCSLLVSDINCCMPFTINEIQLSDIAIDCRMNHQFSMQLQRKVGALNSQIGFS
jgi:hypothetical protein